jgi:hypothetical protein
VCLEEPRTQEQKDAGSADDETDEQRDNRHEGRQR